MAPPPVPFFRGRTVSASEKDGLIAVRPLAGHAFASPPGTRELYLPTVTMVRVVAEPLDEDGQAALRFHGGFNRVDRPDEVVLAPLDARDAHALAAALSARLGLPRAPRPVRRDELAGTSNPPLEHNAYITVVGTQSQSHFEAPDFHGCMLWGDATRLAGRTAGKRYQVSGFYSPPLPIDSRVIGYRGARLQVMAITPEPDGPLRPHGRQWSPPPSPSLRGAVQAFIEATAEHGHDKLEFSTRLDPSTLVVALIDGQGGQRTGNEAARVIQLVLATLLAEPAYEPLLGAPIEPPASLYDDLAAWTAWLVDRAPLPHEPAALLTALDARIGAVLEALNLRGHALGGGGILAVLRAGRATILRRGLARAYLLRAGQLRPLLHEDTMGRAPGFADHLAQSPELAAYQWIATSMFQAAEPAASPPPLEIEVSPGDRLLFVVGEEVLRALEDPAREALLAAAAPDLIAGMPPTDAMIAEGWGVVVVHPDDALPP
jgi:hypothetical protein